jgi:hypothetical protein
MSAMFNQEGLQEGAQRLLDFADSESVLVEALLEYIYTGHVSTRIDSHPLQWASLLKLADFFDAPGLVEHCADGVIGNLSPVTVVESARILRMRRHWEACAKAYNQIIKIAQIDSVLLETMMQTL